jgi:hypothetical protein
VPAAPFIALGAMTLVSAATIVVIRRRRRVARTGDEPGREAW